MFNSSAPVATTGSKDFMLRLKNETANAHRKLESTKISFDLMHPDVTVSQYIIYLQAMLPVVAFTENNVFPVVAPFIHDLYERNKYHKIKNDLHSLGVQHRLDAKTFVPWENILPNSVQALALMYVMEGSTLGGKIISKHILDALGIDAARGASYFNCYGHKSGLLWKSFMESLTAYVAENNNEEELIAEANFVFSNLYNYFESSTE